MQASQLAVKGKSGFLKIIQEIEKLHIKLVESNIKNEAIKKAKMRSKRLESLQSSLKLKKIRKRNCNILLAMDRI